MDCSELGGARVLREKVPLLKVQLAALGHPRRFRQDLRVLGKQQPHLLLGFYIALLAHEPKPVRVVEIFPGADGEQHVMRFRVFLAEVVCIVRRHHGDAKIRRQPKHSLCDQSLFPDAVVLHFEPEPIRPEQLRQPLRARLRLLVVALPEIERDLT